DGPVPPLAWRRRWPRRCGGAGMGPGSSRWLGLGLLLAAGFGLGWGAWRLAGLGRGPAPPPPQAADPGPPLSGRQRALAETRQLGGKVEPDEADPEARGLRVDLRGARDPDEGLRRVRALGAVRVLDLSSTAVSDPALRYLEGL